MRRVFIGVSLLLGIILAMVLGGGGDANADRISDKTVMSVQAPQPGYQTVVCSTYSNSSHPDGGYTVVSPPDNYYINEFAIQEWAPAAAQLVPVGPWATDTDSVSIMATAIACSLEADGTKMFYFPIRCQKLSLTSVDATDDLKVYLYCVYGEDAKAATNLN